MSDVEDSDYDYRIVDKLIFWLIAPKIERFLISQEGLVTMKSTEKGKKTRIEFSTSADQRLVLDACAAVDNRIEMLNKIPMEELVPESLQAYLKGNLRGEIEQRFLDIDVRIKIRKRKGIDKLELWTSEREWKIIKELEKMMTRVTIHLDKVSRQFIATSSQWTNKKNSMEKTQLLAVDVSGSCITVEGLVEEVVSARQDIETFLKEQQNVEEKLDLNTDILRVLKKHFHEEFVQAHKQW